MYTNKNEKCSAKSHETIDAITYCEQCKIYMCKKCNQFHSELFSDHLKYNLNEFKDDIFINVCKEKNHSNKLEYYCKDHNKLCCASCITKIRNKDNGQHKDCDVYNLEDIKEEKSNILKENIKILEDLSKNIDETINDIKIKIEKINQKKEDLKLTIQKIFTEIRNAINEREDYLLLEVDKQFGELYSDENVIKEGNKISNKIKQLLKKCKNTNNNFEKNNLNLFINNCITIENDIKNINDINKNIELIKTNINIDIKFKPENNEIYKFLEPFKNFGKIYKEKIYTNPSCNNIVNINKYMNNKNIIVNKNFSPNDYNYTQNKNYIKTNNVNNSNHKTYNNNNVIHNHSYNNKYIQNNIDNNVYNTRLNKNVSNIQIDNNNKNINLFKNEKNNLYNNNNCYIKGNINILNYKIKPQNDIDRFQQRVHNNKNRIKSNRNRYKNRNSSKNDCLSNTYSLMHLNSSNFSKEKGQRSNTEEKNKFHFNEDNKDLYIDQLAKLKDMGFNDEMNNYNILKECNGDVERAMEKLLNSN